MKTIGIYTLLGLFIILFVMFTSSNKTEVMEERIAKKEAEVNIRRDQVWNLEALASEQNDAIFLKNKVIEAQKLAIYEYTEQIKASGDKNIEINKLEESVKAMEANLAAEKSKSVELEQRLEKAKQSSQIQSKPKPQPKAEVKKESKKEPDPVVKEKEEVKTENPPVEEKEVVEEPKVEAPKEEEDEKVELPVEDDPVPVPQDPIPRPEDPTVPPEDDEVSGTVIEAEATAYIAMCDTGCTGITATGHDVRNTIYYEGLRIVAVDPTVIPFYTKMIVKYGNTEFEAIALDSGGAIKGNKIDILVETTEDAIAFGRRQISVTILE